MTQKPVAHTPMSGEVTYDSILKLKFAQDEPLPMLTRNDVFFKGTTTILTAEAKTGKSTLMQGVAHQWAADGHKVLYFTEEYPRSWAFRSKYLELGEVGDAGTFTVVHPSGASSSDMLIRAVRGPEQIVIVDSMTNLLGLTTHGSAVLDILTPWIRLMQAHGKTLILLHHTNTSGKMAGSYTLKAAVDTLVDYEHYEGMRKMSVTSRMIPEPTSFLVVRDGNMLTIQEAPGTMTLTDTQAQVYAVLDTMTAMAIEDIMDATTFAEGKIRRALRTLVKKKLVKDLSSTGNVKGEAGEWVSVEDE